LSHECPKKTRKTGTTAGYVGQSTKTTSRPAVEIGEVLPPGKPLIQVV
jgi:hypothetical protein